MTTSQDTLHAVDQAFADPESLDARGARALWRQLEEDPQAQARWNTLAQAEGLLWGEPCPVGGSEAQIGRLAFLGALDEQLDQEPATPDAPAQGATVLPFPSKRALSMAAMLCVVGVGAVIASRMIPPTERSFQPRSGAVEAGDHPGVQLYCATPRHAGDGWSIHGAQDEAYGVLTCPQDGKLMVRMARPAHTDGWVAAFGVSDDGRVHWVVPSPARPEPVRVLRGAQRRLGAPVELSVNHRPGDVRMHAIFSEQPIPYEALSQWVRDAQSAGALLEDARLRIGPHQTLSAPYQVLEVAP